MTSSSADRARPARGRVPGTGRDPRAWALLLLATLPLACGQPACHDGPPREEAIAAASGEVIFASTEALGPHLFQTSLQRTEERRSGVPHETDEQVEIAWQDWDAFSVRRTTGDRVLIHNVVYGAVPWVQLGERWERRDDAEPHRVQLRTTWDTWGAVMTPFAGHYDLAYAGDDEIEGRTALRYDLVLRPAEARPPARAWGLQLQDISGQVWLDEATAVRLKADVTIVSTRDGLARTTRMSLSRSRFGEDLGLSAPVEAAPPAPVLPADGEP